MKFAIEKALNLNRLLRQAPKRYVQVHRNIMKTIIFLSIILFIQSCSVDTDYARHHEWKYGIGFSIGDWLSFEESSRYKIQKDTIFKYDKAVALIIDIDKQIGGDTEMTIKSISSGEIGTYHEK